MDLTTVARVKEMAGIGASDTTFDAIFARLIASYSQEFEARLGRHTQTTARTEVQRVRRGDRILSLRAAPVSAAPTSVKYHSTRDFDSATGLSENLDWLVDLEQGLLTFLFPTAYKWGYAQIVYTGGMAADTTAFVAAYPALAEACDLQIAYHWKRQDTPNGTRTVEGGSTNYTGELDLLDTVKRVIEQYRRRYV